MKEREQKNYRNLSNLPGLKNIRKKLRKNLTPAEFTLWNLIKNKKLKGRKFRRQHSIGSYVLDFYCPSENLAIELDGEGHFGSEAENLDLKREKFLNNAGIRVLRFENRMVFEMPESLLRIIEDNFGWNKRINENS